MTVAAGAARPPRERSTAVVRLDEQPLVPDDVLAIARGARLELGVAARRRIEQSRAVVDAHVAGEQLIYGLNTGLGHLRNERMPLESLREYQRAIVALHAGAIGEPLPSEVVRAALAVRVAGIARGGSGASVPVTETLVAMLNAGVHPVVPRVGSVGAADLMHMAAIALVVIGQGRAEFDGEVVSGDEALRRAGISAPTLEPKDGLALVSANGVSVGWAALLVARLRDVAALADVALACSLEACRGNISILQPAAARAKPVPGQADAAMRMLALLRGSRRALAEGAASVQDPLSFRVGPQVHGALRATASHFEQQVGIELAAMDDNPLVDVDGGRLISNGNFHPLAMALAADALRPALAHVGQLSDRRLNHLWTVALASADPTDVDVLGQAGSLAGVLMRYAGAARYTELRLLADPATLDVAPLDVAVEDHSTNAALAVERSEQAIGIVKELLAIELLLAADTLRLAKVEPGELGAGTAAALAELVGIRAELGDAAPVEQVHVAVRDGLVARVLPAAERAAGL